MKTLFVILALLSALGWLVGMIFFSHGILLYLLLFLSVIFFIMKMMWEEMTNNEHTYPEEENDRKLFF